MKKLLPAVIAIFCIVILGVLYVLTDRYRPSREMADLYKHLHVEDSTHAALILNNELLENQAVVKDGRIYLALQDGKSLLNDRFYKGENEDYILYSQAEDTLYIPEGSTQYGVYGEKPSLEEEYTIWYQEEDVSYICLDFIKKFTAFSYDFYENPGRVVITGQDVTKNVSVVTKKKAYVRIRGGIKSSIIKQVQKGQKLYLLEKMDNWSCVMTEDGLQGYIQNSCIKDNGEETVHVDFEEPVFASQTRKDKVVMGWHQVTSLEANDGLSGVLARTKGMNVISPTWFDVMDEQGTIRSFGSSAYTKAAHDAGLEVWALIGNVNVKVDMNKLLGSTNTRVSMVSQLLAYAKEYNLDGINLDFESLPSGCKEGYIQFIRELSVACRKNKLVFSVDNYVPTDYTSFYNRKEQGIFADYVVIMGYDEHYAGSKEAGSVASIGYERAGIEKTLQEVPSNKVISGIPFFTRLWAETPKTKEELAQENENEEYIPYTLSSDAIGMEKAEAVLTDAQGNKTEPVWDEECAQYYAEFKRENVTYKIWLEDARSIEEKMKLVKENELGGVAAWKLGLEKSEIWDVIAKGLQ